MKEEEGSDASWEIANKDDIKSRAKVVGDGFG